MILCRSEWFWVYFKVFFVEHFFEVGLMTGCNRVVALFPYLFEFVPMFWCSGLDCLNIVPVPFPLYMSNGRSDPYVTMFCLR